MVAGKDDPGREAWRDKDVNVSYFLTAENKLLKVESVISEQAIDRANEQAIVEVPVAVMPISNLAQQEEDLTNYMEPVTMLKCRNCSFIASNSQTMIHHLKTVHFSKDGRGESSQSRQFANQTRSSPFKSVDQLQNGSKDDGGEDDEDETITQTIIVESNNGVTSFRAMPNDNEMTAKKRANLLIGGEVVDPERLCDADPAGGSTQPEVGRDSQSNVDKFLTMEKINETKTELESEPWKRIWSCTFPGCCVLLKSAKNLEYHTRCHKDGGFLCPECESVGFLHWKDLTLHLWKIHAINCDLYECGKCGIYKTGNIAGLKTHYLIHSEYKPYVCDICQKRFSQPNQLLNHSLYHLKEKQKEAGASGEDIQLPKWTKAKLCHICSIMFSDGKALKKHVQALHSQLKPYICQVCGFKCARKANLQVHVRQHTGEKPYQCKSCEYKTADHNALLRHERRHTGERPYKCPSCNYSCIQAGQYKLHLKTYHEVDTIGKKVSEIEVPNNLPSLPEVHPKTKQKEPKSKQPGRVTRSKTASSRAKCAAGKAPVIEPDYPTLDDISVAKRSYAREASRGNNSTLVDPTATQDTDLLAMTTTAADIDDGQSLMDVSAMVSNDTDATNNMPIVILTASSAEGDTPGIMVSADLPHLDSEGAKNMGVDSKMDDVEDVEIITHSVIETDGELPKWSKSKLCDICMKVFSDSKSLKKHVQAVHSKLKPYTCSICGFKCSRKANLKVHARKHTGEKPFQCKSCQYSTADKNALNRHERSHRGDKPYNCPYCNYSCIQATQYKLHLQTWHEIDTEGKKLSEIEDVVTSVLSDGLPLLTEAETVVTAPDMDKVAVETAGLVVDHHHHGHMVSDREEVNQLMLTTDSLDSFLVDLHASERNMAAVQGSQQHHL